MPKQQATPEQIVEHLSALRGLSDPQKDLSLAKAHVRALLDICKNEANLDVAAKQGTIGVVVPLLRQACGSDDPASVEPPVEVEELERDICFLLGLLAIKVTHQTAICKAGALPILVSLVARYARRRDPHLSGTAAATARRAADALTNLAHENNGIKDRVRGEGGVPHLVSLLDSVDSKVQRAVAGSLRTLAFKNEDNKQLIVSLGALPLLVQMLYAEDTTLHYEAVGVVGNLVHSSGPIKRAVLAAGALQPVINLLSSPCPDSQREAALLLGQFATEGEFKYAIVQRGAVTPLVEMLSHADAQLCEMAAFALGRLAQNADNQAGIIASGGLLPLLDLLESRLGNLQHNAAFALYGLSDNDDNLVEFVREGAVQRVLACDLIVQASRDCMAKTVRRLQDRLRGRVLRQVLYNMQGTSGASRRRMAVAICCLTTRDTPSAAEKKLAFYDKRALDVVLDMIVDPHTPADLQAQAADSLLRVAEACGAGQTPERGQGDGAAGDMDASPRAGGDEAFGAHPLPGLAPPEPQRVQLGERAVNCAAGSDIAFEVEGRPFYAHRVQLRACSEIFRTMFDGHYREKDASVVPIPNVRWAVWEATMRCIYTGDVEIAPDMAQELLAVSDQYMLGTLKHLCEQAITEALALDNVTAAFELAERFNAPHLAARCVLFCLARRAELVARPGGSRGGFAILMQAMAPRLKAALTTHLLCNAEAEAAAAAEAGAAEGEPVPVTRSGRA